MINKPADLLNNPIHFYSNKASELEIVDHLEHCDFDFLPPLSERLKISEYANKIIEHAIRFEAYDNNILIGLVAIYCNDKKNKVAFISNVSVLQEWTGKSIASILMHQAIKYTKAVGMNQISLEVAIDNIVAINLYTKLGFVKKNKMTDKLYFFMTLNLEGV